MIEYTTRVNKRAKRIKLQYCSYRGLIITSPRKLSKKYLDKLCVEQHDWITEQQSKQAKKETSDLPTQLHLIALDKNYSVQFCAADKNQVVESNQGLQIKSRDKQQLITLKKWIRKQAKKLFLVRLNYWASHTQLNYQKLSVRSQKSRWGSCSSTGTISLNDQLLFMPSSVLDYIIVHELCHTAQPNHSVQFWRLVESHYPNFKQQEANLEHYTKTIPYWFRNSLYQP